MIMPWYREGKLRDLTEILVGGVYADRRYWPETDPPHRYGALHPVDSVTFGEDGWAHVDTHYWPESGNRSRPYTLHWSPDDVIAVRLDARVGSPVGVYRPDDVLFVPGGSLRAQPEKMHTLWDAYDKEDRLIREAVTLVDGRTLLAQQ